MGIFNNKWFKSGPASLAETQEMALPAGLLETNGNEKPGLPRSEGTIQKATFGAG